MPGRRLSSERGSIVNQVGVGLLALTAFMTFVVDYGILWVSRNQAQNAADSAALAGAVALAYDVGDAYPNQGAALNAAQTIGAKNVIWDAAASVDPAGVTFPACAGAHCVRVEVVRDPLPTWFGPLIGVTQQRVRAVATASSLPANASTCLKPWAVANKPGAGYTIDQDMGQPITLELAEPTDESEDVHAGWVQPINVDPTAGDPIAAYSNAIANCVGVIWRAGPDIPQPILADVEAQTENAVEALTALDPDAQWDAVDGRLEDSCVQPEPNYSCAVAGFMHSPRIVSVGVFDPIEFEAGGGPGVAAPRIVNILGVFVEGWDAGTKSIVGRIVAKPDLRVLDADTINPQSSFVKYIQLVR